MSPAYLAVLSAANLVALACSTPVSLDTQTDTDTEAEDDDAVYNGPVPISVDPYYNAQDVDVDKVIRVSFSDHIDSESIRQSRFSLDSGPIGLWVTSYYDPVRGQLVVWPSKSLTKKATWTLNLEKGLEGLDAEAVKPGEVARFRTSEESGDHQPFVVPSFPDQIEPIFKKHCASCHGGEQGIAKLRLDTPEGISDTLIGEGSDGWPGWQRIKPEQPGRSYLIYKIIGDERIAGTPMPRKWNGDGEPLTQSQKETICDWVASGTPFI